MKRWQTICIYGVLFFFLFHIVRDIFQDMGIHHLISDSFVKHDRSRTPWWYWKVFNTYAIAVIAIGCASMTLRKKQFNRWGIATVCVALGFFGVWLLYWFLL